MAPSFPRLRLSCSIARPAEKRQETPIHAIKTDLDGVVILEPRIFGDERGFFFESYNRAVLETLGIDHPVVQENHSASRAAGTVRGLHFQRPPSAQAKLVRVTAGSVFDVAVDIRKGSPGFGRWVGVELSAANRRQLFIPKGFAHGYMTLSENAEVLYLVNAGYDKAAEGGLRWDDPAIGIVWPDAGSGATVNERDAGWPSLGTLDSPFAFIAGEG